MKCLIWFCIMFVLVSCSNKSEKIESKLALLEGDFSELKGAKLLSDSIVLVLNWEGEILEKLKLDFETKIIEVDQNSEFLYAIVEDEDFTRLYRYKL